MGFNSRFKGLSSLKNLTINFVTLYSSVLFTPCYGLKKDMCFEVELVRNVVVQTLNIVVGKKIYTFFLSFSCHLTNVSSKPHNPAKYVLFT